MPHYHLNLYNDIDAMDEDGADFPDLTFAKAMAIRSARDLMAEHVRIGRPIDLSHRIEITDDDGRVLAILPFREMITIVDGHALG